MATPEDTVARILSVGTICYVDTGSRRIGITANHVYKKYLADKEKYGTKAIECQFGSSTIYPERRVRGFGGDVFGRAKLPRSTDFCGKSWRTVEPSGPSSVPALSGPRSRLCAPAS